MTNRKIKGNKVYDNLRAREYWDASERNVCATWLALLNLGVSKAKILEVEQDFHEDTVGTFRRDAEDGVIDVIERRFMDSVNITDADVHKVLDKYADRLGRAFNTAESYSKAYDCLKTDFVMLLYEISAKLGYGEKRLKRVIEFVASYTGDAKVDVANIFNIHYPDPDALPDITTLYAGNKDRRRQQARACEQAAKTIDRRVMM